SRVINYAEKRAVEKSGMNCDPNYAKAQFKSLRELHGKNDGIQAHTIIQSFKPHETTEKQANQIGLELAEKIADGFQVSVYTHNDTEHIHNHIVINAVGLDGQKYKSNAKQRYHVKDMNDELCREHGLSVVEQKNADMNYTLAEKSVLEKGQSSWKDEIRQAIILSKGRNNDFESFQEDLGELGIETKLRGSTVSYKHPDVNKWVRAKKLGSDYELEGLENEFARQIERTETKTIDHSRDWEQFEKFTVGKRIVRTEKAKQSVERENDRDREITGREESENRHPVRKTRQRDNGMEL
ncbi:Relaxase/Mobilisation nuclease domain-containing protein, partial [Pseudomonas aeruginosa DSM 50071 = NBRC 12689]